MLRKLGSFLIAATLVLALASVARAQDDGGDFSDTGGDYGSEVMAGPPPADHPPVLENAAPPPDSTPPPAEPTPNDRVNDAFQTLASDPSARTAEEGSSEAQDMKDALAQRDQAARDAASKAESDRLMAMNPGDRAMEIARQNVDRQSPGLTGADREAAILQQFRSSDIGGKVGGDYMWSQINQSQQNWSNFNSFFAGRDP